MTGRAHAATGTRGGTESNPRHRSPCPCSKLGRAIEVGSPPAGKLACDDSEIRQCAKRPHLPAPCLVPGEKRHPHPDRPRAGPRTPHPGPTLCVSLTPSPRPGRAPRKERLSRASASQGRTEPREPFRSPVFSKPDLLLCPGLAGHQRCGEAGIRPLALGLVSMAAADLLQGPPPRLADLGLEAGRKETKKAALGAGSPGVQWRPRDGQVSFPGPN